MLVECTHCAAPLDVTMGKTVYKCNYCGRKNVQQQMRVVAQVTPSTWQPPKQWVPPAHVAMHGQQLKYSRTLGCITILPILVGVFVPMIAVFFGSGGGSMLQVLMWDEASTITCPPNGDLTLEDVDAKVKSGAVIEMQANCTLTLINSTIEGPIGIKGGGNSVINVESSTITAEDAAIKGGGNTKLKVTGKSVLESEVIGIDAGANAKIELDAATVSGGETGIEGSGNMKVSMRSDSTVEGKEVAIRLGSNGDVDIRDSKIVSKKGIAIEGGANNEVKCRGGEIKGKKALVLKFNADLRLGKCKVKGQQDVGRNAKRE
jgi:hypothetical protein